MSNYVTGSPDRDITVFFAEEYLSGKQGIKSISLGSGDGSNEIELSRCAQFSELIGYDVNPRLVNKANRKANAEKHPEAKFVVANVELLEIPAQTIDLVLAFHSLHHIREIDQITARFHQALKVGGLLFVYDYVGPNRFQWPKTQLNLANKLLSEIPESYRRISGTKVIKKRIGRPGILRMVLSDPSEAVESESIRPSLRKLFQKVAEFEIGGTLLHIIFSEIAGNFAETDPEAIRIVDHCIKKERQWINEGLIQSDFLVGVYRKS